MVLPAVAAAGAGGGVGLEAVISSSGLEGVLGSFGKLEKGFDGAFGKIQGMMGGVNKVVGGANQMFQLIAGNALAFFMIFLRHSAMFGAYMEEFNEILGYIGDVLVDIISPIIDPLLEFMWTLADSFADLSPMIRDVMEVVGTALTQAFELLLPVLNEVIATLQRHPEILQAITILALALAAAFVSPLLGVLVAIAAAVGALVIGLGWLLDAFENLGLDAGAIFKALGDAWNVLGSTFKAVYEAVIEPAWNALSNTIEWGYENIIRPTWSALSAAWSYLSSIFSTTYESGIKPTWAAFSTAIEWGYENVIRPVWSALSTAWDTLADGIDAVYKNIIKPVFDAILSAWGTISGIGEGIGGVGQGIGNWLGGLEMPSFGDVIWRAGEGPIAISPNDNVMAFQGDSPMGGGGTSVTINIERVSSDVDIDDLADKVSRAISRQSGRHSYYGG